MAARQRAQEVRGPLRYRRDGARPERPGGPVYAGILRRSRERRLRPQRSDLHRGIAARRLDAARADPRLALWDQVLPGAVLRVEHESVVADLEASVRRMLEFLGLPFEPACLEFCRTERSVRTASSEQVRRPIYREGLDHWRHFERWLRPLKIALGDLASPQ